MSESDAIVKTQAAKVAALRRILKDEGKSGGLTWLSIKGVFSLIAVDKALGEAAKRAGFEETPAGTFTTTSALTAAKFANLADEEAVVAFEAKKINVAMASTAAEANERRRSTRTANRAADARVDNFETFDGWKAKGRFVVKGEKAAKRVGEESLFHFSQTYDPKEFRADRDTFDGWLAQGRAVREGETAAQDKLFHVSQTDDFIQAFAARGLRTFEGWKEVGRGVRKGEKNRERKGGFFFFEEEQTDPFGK